MNKSYFAILSVAAVLLAATAALARGQGAAENRSAQAALCRHAGAAQRAESRARATGKRPDFLVPAGTVNLAKGKKVTASDNDPVVGTLDLITDGDKDGDEGSWVELGPGKQWVQIDLRKGREYLRRAGLAFSFAGARVSRRCGAGFRRSEVSARV